MPLPWRFLRIDQLTMLSFSNNGRFLLLGSGQNCVVYDAELTTVRRFAVGIALDSPQAAVAWFDGYRLSYVSDGTLHAVDHDSQNNVKLQTALASHPIFFSSDQKSMLSFSTGENGIVKLDTTALIIEKQ